MNNKSFVRIILILFVPVLLLLIPWALRFDWSLMDFAIAYALLAGAGLAYELITGKTENAAGWIFGIIAFAIGVINTLWGNDRGYGIFILLLSFVYFPPINALFSKWIGFSIPRIAKILLGLFILWSALGVGELFYKIHLMMQSFS